MSTLSGVTYFLLVYDRSAGEILREEEFPEAAADQAMARRAQLKLESIARPDIEVVVLGAGSRDELVRTHARYFQSVREMVANG
jgi:hypothetical protein